MAKSTRELKKEKRDREQLRLRKHFKAQPKKVKDQKINPVLAIIGILILISLVLTTVAPSLQQPDLSQPLAPTATTLVSTPEPTEVPETGPVPPETDGVDIEDPDGGEDSAPADNDGDDDS